MASRHRGYYRFPAVWGSTIAFACEGDIWLVGVEGGRARRLTSGTGQAQHLRFSPDGKLIAYTADDDGAASLYVIPSDGGPSMRLTFDPGQTLTSGFTADSRRVLFSTAAHAPHPHQLEVYAVPVEGGLPERLPVGPALLVGLHPDGKRIVLNRHGVDPARWKRYRGGKAGDLWRGNLADKKFERLVSLPGNCAHPFWCRERVFFVSDHEGFGNLYSVDERGGDLRRHTSHREFYVRWPSGSATEPSTIVYQHGGEIWTLDAERDAPPRQLHIEVPSPLRETRKRYVGVTRYLEDVALHPDGASALYNVRGQLVAMSHWQGAPRTVAGEPGVRFRMGRWLPDGKRILCISDRGGEEGLELHSLEPNQSPRILGNPGHARIDRLVVAPDGTRAALVDQERRTFMLSIEDGSLRKIDATSHASFSHAAGDFAWSADSRYLAYSQVGPEGVPRLRLHDTTSGETVTLLEAEHDDFNPCFDPEGRWIAFLSRRVLNPVLGSREISAGFPRAVKPYLLPLRKDVVTPFDRWEPDGPLFPDPLEHLKKHAKERQEGPRSVTIDLDGIARRVREVPVRSGSYARLHTDGERIFLLELAETGMMDEPEMDAHGEPPADRTLWAYDLESRELNKRMDSITDFDVASQGQALAIVAGSRLRVIPVEERFGQGNGPGKDGGDRRGEAASRKSGWVDTKRIQVEVDPKAEWRQILVEAWRMQRDYFWTADISKVDWPSVRERYLPLLERVATRHELSDVIWEMLGELGTSHAYEAGGDLERGRALPVGQLCADLTWRPDRQAYEITAILQGDSWASGRHSPLEIPGLGVSAGDLLLAIDGRPLDAATPPAALLVNRAGREVAITVTRPEAGATPRVIVVKTLASELPVRNRSWVDANRRRVAEATGGRAGYVHVPDMMGDGLVEFHRAWWAQWTRAGLVVDARFNRGGFIGQLLLEKLARRVIGWVKPRWSEPEPFPHQSLSGPIVVLCNEYTGSDGDIFCQSVRSLGLGPLIGKRTWGGVVGIDPSRRFVDGGLSTQPEYAFWFPGPRWDVENTGVAPDIEVEYPPEAWVEGQDPQLAKGIEVILGLLEKRPGGIPDFGPPPDRRPPHE